jgi:Ca2+-binding EF-hand superfamily protein
MKLPTVSALWRQMAIHHPDHRSCGFHDKVDVVKAMTMNGHAPVPCRDLFEALDTDHSGGLDARELAEGLLARGYRVSREEMDQLIDRMDLNQDGTIAFDEFSSALVDWQKVHLKSS